MAVAGAIVRGSGRLVVVLIVGGSVRNISKLTGIGGSGAGVFGTVLKVGGGSGRLVVVLNVGGSVLIVTGSRNVTGRTFSNNVLTVAGEVRSVGRVDACRWVVVVDVVVDVIQVDGILEEKLSC